MTNRERKHKTHHVPSLGYLFSECGSVWLFACTDWRRVTCKRCLARKAMEHKK